MSLTSYIINISIGRIPLWIILSLAATFTFHYIDNRRSQHLFKGLTIISLLSALVYIGFSIHLTTGSVFISMLTLAGVMTAVVFILDFIQFKIIDYAVFFTAFLCLSRFTELALYWGSAASLLVIFIIITLTGKIRLGSIQGSLFHIWFTFVITSSSGFAFQHIYESVIRQIGYSFTSNYIKLLIWGLAAVVTISVSTAIIYLIKRVFSQYFFEINQMGKSYPKVERQFIYTSLSILIAIIVFYFSYTWFNGYTEGLNLWLSLFAFSALIIQLLFLTLLYRVAYLKDSLKITTSEQENMIAYTSDLEKNLEDIKGLRHDMKNIFFTMGQFVEDSGNADMIAFYREKINPFIEDELAKSDLYSKLLLIDNEQLRAFFYYKIAQGIERGALIGLSISTGYSSQRADLIDIVRILGIILDNAIEECLEIKGGEIRIDITQNQNLTVYRIENTVDPQKQTSGIRSGVSSKGADRGLGLTIVHRIIDQYDNVVLNSFFKDNNFVQSLSIYE